MAYIWKEGLEQARGKGLWLGLGLIMFASIFIIAEARSFPAELGFEAMLLSLFDTNMYLVPLFSMFLSSFSMFQEKEMKTAVI
ncbi:MAG TPA: copper ABC transporter permease, partial [Cerasibacillus sp.]